MRIDSLRLLSPLDLLETWQLLEHTVPSALLLTLSPASQFVRKLASESVTVGHVSSHAKLLYLCLYVQCQPNCGSNVFHCEGGHMVTRDGLVLTPDYRFQNMQTTVPHCPILFIGYCSSSQMMRDNSASSEDPAVEHIIAIVRCRSISSATVGSRQNKVR